MRSIYTVAFGRGVCDLKNARCLSCLVTFCSAHVNVLLVASDRFKGRFLATFLKLHIKFRDGLTCQSVPPLSKYHL